MSEDENEGNGEYEKTKEKTYYDFPSPPWAWIYVVNFPLILYYTCFLNYITNWKIGFT